MKYISTGADVLHSVGVIWLTEAEDCFVVSGVLVGGSYWQGSFIASVCKAEFDLVAILKELWHPYENLIKGWFR